MMLRTGRGLRSLRIRPNSLVVHLLSRGRLRRRTRWGSLRPNCLVVYLLTRGRRPLVLIRGLRAVVGPYSLIIYTGLLHRLRIRLPARLILRQSGTLLTEHQVSLAAILRWLPARVNPDWLRASIPLTATRIWRWTGRYSILRRRRGNTDGCRLWCA